MAWRRGEAGHRQPWYRPIYSGILWFQYPWTKWPTFHRRSFQKHFFNEKDRILIKISLKFAPKGRIDNNPALVQIMARPLAIIGLQHLSSWRHQMETFSTLLAFFVRGIHRSPVDLLYTGQRREALICFIFYLRLNKWLSKRSKRLWLETPSRSSWRHSNDPKSHPCGQLI